MFLCLRIDRCVCVFHPGNRKTCKSVIVANVLCFTHYNNQRTSNKMQQQQKNVKKKNKRKNAIFLIVS